MTLAEHLRRTGETPIEFGQRLGAKSPATVYRYLNGTRRPSRRMLFKIAELTDNAVTANDWHKQPPPAAAPAQDAAA